RSPQRLPRLAAVEDPDRGITAAPGAFQAAQKMVLAEARQVEKAAPLGVAEGALEIGRLHAGLELVFMDADDLAHFCGSLPRAGSSPRKFTGVTTSLVDYPGQET